VPIPVFCTLIRAVVAVVLHNYNTTILAKKNAPVNSGE